MSTAKYGAVAEVQGLNPHLIQAPHITHPAIIIIGGVVTVAEASYSPQEA